MIENNSARSSVTDPIRRFKILYIYLFIYSIYRKEIEGNKFPFEKERKIRTERRDEEIGVKGSGD